MGYIYKITNKINGHSYVGKTEHTIEERWKGHLKNIKRYSDKLPLYKALNKYGVENFFIEQIEKCDNQIIDDREIYWIAYYNTYHQGYNCTGGGEGGIKDYHEHINEIIERYNNGEHLDLLCKEFHYDYASIRPKLIEKGLKINTQAGPQKLSKQIKQIDPITKEIINIYPSISAAARAICPEGHNPRAIGNHISKQKNTGNICHNYLWETFKGDD